MEIVNLNINYTEYAASIIKERWKVSDEYVSKKIQKYLSNQDNSICFIAIINNTPIGLGVFENTSSIDKDLFGWNCLLYIEPEYRGNNYGNLLTEKRFEHAISLGYKEIYLDTYNAKDYHLKFNWIPIKEIKTERGIQTIMKYVF